MFWNKKKKQKEEEKRRLEEQRLREEEERRIQKEEEERRLRRQREDEYLKELERKKAEEEQKAKQKAEEPLTIVDESLVHYSLEALSGEYEGVEFALEPDDFMMLGRNPTKANIVLSDLRISGFHCQVRYSVDDRCFQVVDFSSYGTFVNGQRLEKNNLEDFPAGSVLQLAGSEEQFLLKAEKALY